MAKKEQSQRMDLTPNPPLDERGLNLFSDKELADIVRSSKDEYGNESRTIALRELKLRTPEY